MKQKLKEIMEMWKGDSHRQDKIWFTLGTIHPLCGKSYAWIHYQLNYHTIPLIMRTLNRLRKFIYALLTGKKRIDTSNTNTKTCFYCGLPMIGRRFWINPDFTVHKLPFVVLMIRDNDFDLINVDGTEIEEKHFVESKDTTFSFFDMLMRMRESPDSITATDLIFFEKHYWNSSYRYVPNTKEEV